MDVAWTSVSARSPTRPCRPSVADAHTTSWWGANRPAAHRTPGASAPERGRAPGVRRCGLGADTGAAQVARLRWAPTPRTSIDRSGLTKGGTPHAARTGRPADTPAAAPGQALRRDRGGGRGDRLG